jgi:hypothetical protein
VSITSENVTPPLAVHDIVIARELFIFEHTVKRHVYAIFKKTGAKRSYGLLPGRPR